MSVTTFQDLPLADRDREWDGAAAEKRVRAWAGADEEPNERYRDARLTALHDHDSEHATDLARSLLAYLDHFGDVKAASSALHVHPNTLRYRVRRATDLTGIDLADATERLNTHLQLLLTKRTRHRPT